MNPKIIDGILYGADDVVARWVQKHCSGEAKIDVPAVALGVTKGKTLAGGIIFYSQRGNDIQCAVACVDVTAWLPRVVATCMRYPFVQLGLDRVTAEIELKNTRSARLAEGLGFVREGVKRRAASDGGHVAVYGLLRKDFRFKGHL